MNSLASIVFSIIGMGFALSQIAQAAPPYAGTVWLDQDIIKESDPTAFKSLTANGQGTRGMYDNRDFAWHEVNAFLFDANFDDGIKIEVLVNPEFGDAAAALVQATKYAPVLGRMPACIRTQLKTFSINAGDAYFACQADDLMIHTATAEGYATDGWFEEWLIYEAGHTLDAAHSTSAGWIAAQAADPEYISTWAKSYPLEQDITESFMAYLAVRHRVDRITSSMAATISATIPNRIAYFDGLTLDMHPMASEGPPHFTGSAPPATGTVGIAYSHTCMASGSAPMTYTVTAGALPTPLTLSPSGVISGTPSVAGTFTGTITVANGILPNASQDFSITILPPGKDILTFDFGALGSATITGTNIFLTVPSGTVVTNLAPTFTLSPGASCDHVSGTAYDFTNPVVYTVLGADLTTKGYTVTTSTIPRPDQLMYSFDTADLGADGSVINSWGGFAKYGTGPTVAVIDGVKWERNLRDSGSDGFDGGAFGSKATNGASYVMAIKPIRIAQGDPWTCLFDMGCMGLTVGIRNNTGGLIVFRKGTQYEYATGTAVIPDGQNTILSCIFQEDGSFRIFANGVQIVNNTTTTDPNLPLNPVVPWYGGSQQAAGSWPDRISLGRTNGAGWSVFNGYIGDTYIYKVALTDVERQQLEAKIASKLTGNGPSTHTITASAGTGGSISPSGAVTVNAGVSQTFTITVDPGYTLADVSVDGSSVGAVASQTFTNVTADHTIAATFVTVSAPEIAVEQPAGTDLADGGTKHFGSVNVGSNMIFAFTIRNTGNADLTGLTITKDGANAADFTVTSNPVAPVSGPSGTTTFTVQFAPAAAGSRTAAIHIANNDSDENPFDINLTGIGIAAEKDILTFDFGALGPATIAGTGIFLTVPYGTVVTNLAPTFTLAPGATCDHISGNPYNFTNPVTYTVLAADLTTKAYIVTIYKSSTITPPSLVTLLFSTNTESLPEDGAATGAWAQYLPSGGPSFATIGTPTVKQFGGVKWEKNSYTNSDGFRVGQYAAAIPCNGASIVMAVKPTRNTTPAPWSSLTDIFYNRLMLGLGNADGRVIVKRNGSNTQLPANTAIPDGQVTILSLVVQADGTYKVFANGSEIYYNATTSAMISLDPTWNGGVTGYWSFINLGRNNSDIWSSFNGLIGDTFVYTSALSDSERQALEAALTAKFATNATLSYTITASAGANGSISPSGDTTVLQGDDKIFTITPNTGWVVGDVLVDGVSVGTLPSYTFTSVQAAHTIAAMFVSFPDQTITASAGTNGSISPGGIVTVSPGGTDKTFMIQPNTGYKVANVLVDGVSQGEIYTYTFTRVSTSLHTISATFAPLGRNIPQTDQLLFSAVTASFAGNEPSATGDWASYVPAGRAFTAMATPTVKQFSGTKWEKNDYADGDGFRVGQYATAIPCNGASIVVAVKPTRNGIGSGYSWSSVVDVFYSRLVLTLDNADGRVRVIRNGSNARLPAETAIPDGQITILSLVVQADGTYKVFANGGEIFSDATTSPMTSLDPKWNGGVAGFGSFINIGRNNPDDWSTFNGHIGDVFVYTTALSDTERQALEADLTTKFINNVPPNALIAVEQPAGSGLASGTSTVDFGSSLAGTAAPLTFTIKNTGAAPLTGIAVTKDGTNSGEYAITTAPASTVAAGGSTTFVVTFTPSALGTRTATLHIASNDPSKNPFNINLSGTGGVADKDILTFNFGALGPATITGTSISLTVPTGTVLTSLSPTFTLSPGATCDHVSGAAYDFTNPVTYTVLAADLTTKSYTVTVSVTPPYTYVIANGQVTLTGYTGTGDAVSIPATIDGLPVTGISDYAFVSNPGLTSVVIPGGITTIGIAPFADCAGLTAITVDAANANYCSVAGVLFDKAQTVLIQYPGAKSGPYILPISITDIGDYAFYNCANLTSITMGNGVVSIGIGAFYLCTHLPGITLPASVTAIGDVAFGECYALASARFTGNAPLAMGGDVFMMTASGFTVEYYTNKNGFTSPLWNGYPAVNLGAPPSAKDILTFDFGALGAATIAGTNIYLTVPAGTDLANLVPTFTLSPDATCDHVSGNPYDFTNPVTYTVLAADLTTKAYTVTVSVAPALASDLVADWSNASNPNGVWSLNTGSTVLPSAGGWGPGGFPSSDKVWSFGGTPVWCKVTAGIMPAVGDVQVGDVVTHTTDVTGGLTGASNVTWTSPITGKVNISGNVWQTRAVGRANHWSLTIGGTVVTGGDFSRGDVAATTATSRAAPFAFALGTGGAAALTQVSVNAGDVIKLQIDRTTTYGDYLGVNLTITNGQPAARLVAEQQAGVSLTNNSSTVNFGSSPTGTGVPLTFVIRNTGTAPLTGLTVTSDGTNSADYTLTTAPATSIVAGGTSTFVVTCTPSAIGTRAAALHIASSDASQNPFNVNLTGTGTPAIAEGIDQTGLAISVGGTAPWFTQSTTTHDGIDAARSGSISHSQDSWMQTTLTGPGTLTYWWKVSSQAGSDYLEFYLDGVLQSGRIAGEVNWLQRSHIIPSGAHTVKWRYMKNASVTSGQDAGWVDEVNFVPGDPGPGPLVTTGIASAITAATTILQGTVNPNGLATTVKFEYGLTTAYGSTASVTLSPNNDWTAQNVSANLSGLQAATTYHYRLTATNTGGAPLGADLTFTTYPTVPYTYTTTNGNVTITGYTGTGGAVSIPATINGLPVTVIGDYAFYNKTSVTSVTIPAGVTTIGRYAFYSCTNLTSVTLPVGVTSIGEWAFRYCIRLPSITLPAGLTSIGELAFRDCYSLTSVTIPASVTSIGSMAFQICRSLTTILVDEASQNFASVDGILFNKDLTSLIACPTGKAVGNYTFPTSVTTIRELAFDWCAGLTGMTLHAGITSIGDGPFANCANLPAISVDAANPNFASVDGILYDKGLTMLIQFPGGKAVGSYAIHPDVTGIGFAAFGGVLGLTGVTLPASLTNIGSYALVNCSNLKAAVFYGNAPAIGEAIFGGAANGFTVKYYNNSTGFTSPTWQGYTAVNLGMPPLQIVVEQPAGTGLDDGGASDFAGVAVGNSVSRVFTIRNPDEVEITGLAMTKDGVSRGDFSVGPLGATTLAPGASTTFEVTFTPSAAGSRAAALHITSNDLTKAPFTLNLLVGGGLVANAYDSTYGASYLNPIANLMAIAPSGTRTQVANIDYGNFVASFPGLTNGDTFSMLWQGWLDVSKDGPGIYTFGTNSDDGSAIFLDLNGDGDFADPGELVVDSNWDHAPLAVTGPVMLGMDAVRIAIGYYEYGGSESMTAGFKKGNGLAYGELNLINGTSGHFFSTQVPVNPAAANVWNFGLSGQPSVVDGTQITWYVPLATDVTALAPTFTISPGATAVPPSGTTRDFSIPQTYSITAQDGTIMVYTVTVVTNGGLNVATYNTAWGSANLCPISNLMALTPSGTGVEVGPINYSDNNFVPKLPGLTNEEYFSVLWTGWFDVTKDGYGNYSFGTNSDESSVVYFDLNNDGDFDDPGELVVDGSGWHSVLRVTGTVSLNMDAVRIAIGHSQTVGGRVMELRFKKGSAIAFDAMDSMSGSSGHFFTSRPAARTTVANLWAFGLPGKQTAGSDTNLTLTVPYGTDVTRLAPTYTISDLATCDKPSGSVQDFTNPQTYTVASADALTTKAYVVTVLVSRAWTNDGSGSWGDSANWANQQVASGANITAAFDGIDITGDRTVTLDSARVIGNMNFGDTSAATTAGGWIVNNNGNSANILTLAGSSPTITVNTLGAARDATIDARLSGTAGLIKSGPGTLTLTNSGNDFSGDTRIMEGVLRLAGSGGRLGSGSIFNYATLVFDCTGSVVVSNPITSPGPVNKNGAGTVLLNGTNLAVHGDVTVNGGTLAVDGYQSGNRMSYTSHVVTVTNPGSTFEIRGLNALQSDSLAVGFAVNSGAILRIVSGGSTAIGSAGQSHAHIWDLALNGGTVDLAYSGAGTAINGQSCLLWSAVTVGGNAMSTIRYGSGATAANAGLGLSTASWSIVNFNVGDVTAGPDLTVSAEIEGGGFTKTGAGTMLSSANNTYTGLTTVSAGTLELSGNNSAATGGITISGGIAQFDSPASINGTARNVTVNAAGTVLLGPTFGASNIPAALNRIVASSAGVIAVDNYASTNISFSAAGLTAASLGANGNVTYSGTVTPNGTTYRLGGGSGTLTLGNPLGGSGRTLVVNGNLILKTANTFTGTTTINSGKTLQLGTGVTGQNGSLTSLAISNSGALLWNDFDNQTYVGVISGSGTLTKSGAGQLTLSVPQTYTGSTTVSGGTLVLAGGNHTLAVNRTLTLNTGGTLDLGGNSQYVGNFSGTGGIVTGSGGRVTVRLTGATTFAGSIQGSVSLAKIGPTLTLTGDNITTGSVALLGGDAPDINDGVSNGLKLSNAGRLSGATAFTLNNGSLFLDNSGTANDTNRINDAAAIALNGGRIIYTGRSATASAELLGNATLNSGHSTLTATAGGSGSAEVTFNSLTRNTGATLRIDGTNLGTAGNNGRILVATPLAGNLAMVNGIVPGVCAGVPGATAQTVVTYDSTNGFQALSNYSTQASLADVGASENVDWGITTTLQVKTGGQTVNSLSACTASGGSITFDPVTGAADTLVIGSGMLVQGSNSQFDIGSTAVRGKLTSDLASGELFMIKTNEGTSGGVVAGNIHSIITDRLATRVKLVLATYNRTDLGNQDAALTANNTHTGGTLVAGGNRVYLAATTAGDTPIPAANDPGQGLVIDNSDVTMLTNPQQIAAANIVTLNGGSTLDLAGTNTLAGLVFNSNGGKTAPKVTPYNTVTAITAPVYGTKTGTLTITGNITSTPNDPSQVALIDSGTLDLNGTDTHNVTVTALPEGNFVNNLTSLTGMTIASAIQNGGFTKQGTGVLNLTGLNTFAGQLTVAQGVLSVAAVNNAATSGVLGNSANPVILGSSGGNTGTLEYTGGSSTSSTKRFTLAGGGSGAFQVDNSITLTLNGQLDGGGGLLKTGNGTLTLGTVNTYTGDTTVTRGALVLADNAGLRFIVTDSSNNRITGTGIAILNGDLIIDTDAVTVTTGSWTLVDVATLTEAYGATFTVAGAGWSESSNVWTKAESNRIWTFSKSTGILTVASALTSTSSNGAITITGYIGSGGAVSIPDTLNGLPVTSIGDFAFYQPNNMTSITLPVSVTSIGDFAFYKCSGLTSITLHAGITRIGDFAFYACSGLTNIVIPASVTSIGNYAFASCGNLADARLGSGLTSIGDGAFYLCGKLTHVTIPNKVASIGEFAFELCTGLSSASFTGNAPAMGTGVFASTAAGLTVYSFEGATGFTSPTWLGHPAVNMGASSPLPIWLIEHGLPYNANPQDDSNNDGVSLLMAYALNLDPYQNLSGSMPQPVITAGQMSLTFYAGSDGVTYAVESSTDLLSWTRAGVTLSAPDSNKTRTASVLLTSPQQYLRIVVATASIVVATP